MNLQAVIFDLDGVVTDTAEYHYQAWKRLADEEGLPFDREINERLRGVSRRASLEIILGDRQATEAQIAEMMERKNSYYVAMLKQVTQADLLPGVLPLLQELHAAGIKIAIGSASKNARTVLAALGIEDLLDAIADGYSTGRPKPAPDLFLKAAEMLNVSPGNCAVVEDAAAGIDAALAAGMWSIGLGPDERVGHAHARFDSLDGVTLADIRNALEAASWTVTEPTFDPASQHQKETMFTVGNGYLCVRGTFEEGYPGDRPASFVHRVWDDRPVNFTELANIPHWWGVDIWINGVRFQLNRGKVLSYRRQLDLRTGVLSRTVRWQPVADGPVVDIHFERFASLANPHLAAVQAQIRAVEGQADLRLRTGLNVHVENTGLLHWRLVEQEQMPDEVRLHARTRSTGIELAMVATVSMSGTIPWTIGTCDADGQPAIERRAVLHAGDYLVVDKFVGIVTNNESTDPMQTATDVAREAATRGYVALRTASDAEWAKAWETSDMVVEGDIEAQIALRFNIFQLLIAAPRWTDRASIGAKTLSGFGYRHHTFWDTEIFMLPLFIYTQPDIARNMLMYRWHNLPGAREKAAANGYEGAQFPWESTADGREVTPIWVADPTDRRRLIRIWTGDIEIHITADVAYGAVQYWQVTGDDAWMRDYGAELVLEGAKFWASAAELDPQDGKYHFRDVIGPDEYHDHVDDNAFTNFMARWHLEAALDLLAWLEQEYPEQHARLCAALDLTKTRLAHWAEVVDGMYLPEDPETGFIEQFTGYLALEDADVAALRDPARSESMQTLLGIEGCAATQIIKQPDVLMLQYLLADRFRPEQVRVNYDYYDQRTDHEHGSSLGPAISAIMACRVGDCPTGYEYFMRAARTDLSDVRHNASDGIHGANAGGLWQAAVFGFAGLRVHKNGWEIHPLLPTGWTRLAFKFYYRGELENVDIREVATADGSRAKP